MLATYTGTAFQVNYVVGAFVMVMTALVMLRNKIFSNATAYAAIPANVIGLGLKTVWRQQELHGEFQKVEARARRPMGTRRL